MTWDDFCLNCAVDAARQLLASAGPTRCAEYIAGHDKRADLAMLVSLMASLDPNDRMALAIAFRNQK